MTQKQRVRQFCIEHLQSRALEQIFDYSAFDHFYKKRKGEQANAYTLGLTAADFIISQKLNNTQKK